MSQPLAKARKPVRLHECDQNMHVLLVSKALQYGKNEEHYMNIGLRHHTSRRRQRMRIHRRLSLRHIPHHKFPISSLVNKFLTLDLALSEQLNTIYEAFETTRLFPQRVALEPALREELVDLREEGLGKGDALRFAVCAKRLRPADFQAVEPGDEDPV
jgi:hypothetical protein